MERDGSGQQLHGRAQLYRLVVMVKAQVAPAGSARTGCIGAARMKRSGVKPARGARNEGAAACSCCAAQRLIAGMSNKGGGADGGSIGCQLSTNSIQPSQA